MKAFLIVMFCLLTATTAAAADTAENLITTMTDESATWEVRDAAEDALTKIFSQDVLQGLLSYVGKGMPTGAIWNSGGRELDKDAPVKWQIFYAVDRSWNYQVSSLPRESAGSLLLALFEKATTANARDRILDNMTHRWIPEAEAPVAAILKSPQESARVRENAALVLIFNGTGDYHHLFLEYAKQGDFVQQKRWFGVLSYPRHKQRTGVDPRVVELGFDLMLKELAASPGDVDGAYFFASWTGDYIGQKFMPDHSKAEYQGEHGLAESFFRDTVKNAVDWWAKNKTGIEAQISTTGSSVP
jgi:hypothetical protein